MCAIIWKHGLEYIESDGELRAKWNVEPVYSLLYDGLDRNPKGCLCPVDIPATAKRAGVTIQKNDHGEWEQVSLKEAP